MDEWTAQELHLETHNLFYSAVVGENSTGITDIGFNIVGEFMRLYDPRGEIDVEPPYTMYDGQSVIFFDFLTPGRIDDWDVTRISKYNKIGLETVEDHLRRVDISESFDQYDIEVFDHCTVCRKTQYDDYSTGSGEKRRTIDRLEQESCVATVSSGGQLVLESGELHDPRITDLLRRGIDLPETTASLIYLPRQMKKEALAVGICEEIVLGSDLRDGGVALDHEDIRNHFGRDVPYDRLDDVFQFLRKINACRKRQDDGQYLFTKFALENIMRVRDVLSGMTIDEFLDGGDGINRSIEEYF